MQLNRILLYYLFTPIADPEAVRLWQKALCEKLGMTGRILISKDGINGTVGGSMHSAKKYVRAMKEYAPFKLMEFKWSEGGAEDFPRLSIKVRKEIVSFGAPDELLVDENGVVGGGVHLKPQELHAMLDEKKAAGEEVVFFDGRNAMEAEIGRMKDAIVPDVETTHDFKTELDSGKYDHLKDKPVVTYCTGGIRCEVLSRMMVNRGFKEVYQMDGGIVRYGEAFGDKGLWEGSLYVFDKRMHMEFSDDAKVIGKCSCCGEPTNDYVDCGNDECGSLRLICPSCVASGAANSCPKCRDAA